MTLLKKLFGKKESKEKLVSVLEEFINQIYWGEDLNQEESKRNIKEGLIETTKYGQHYSNGLLITNNGYFLTPKHCIENLTGLAIKYNNKNYNVKVCAVGKKEEDDFAFVRANIPGECKIKKYKFGDNKLGKIPVILMTRREGEIIEKYGLMENGSHYFKLFFCGGKPGDSGGIVISPDGKIRGINIGGTEEFNFGINLIKVLELIHFYKEKVKSGEVNLI